MRFSVAIVALTAAAANAYSYGNETEYTTTEIVASYTTYCSKATTVVQNSQTYTVSEPGTLTISNCPCTVTKTYATASSSAPPAYPTSAEPPKAPVTEAAPPPAATGTGKPPSYGNSTNPSPTVSTVPKPTASGVVTKEEGDAANRATVAGGALAALLGAFVYLL